MPKEILAQVLKKYSENSEFESTTRLKDLGLDSIGFLMSLMELEDKVQKELDISNLTLDSTVEDVLQLIKMD